MFQINNEKITYIKEWLDVKVSTGRYSNVLVTELAEHLIAGTAHVHMIFDEIGHLEATSKPTTTKPAAKFTGKLLKGLWHKHYTQPEFLDQNLLNHWKGGKIESLAEDNFKEGSITDRDIGRFVRELVIGGYEQRSEKSEITGQWIVYARHDDVNYYLTLGVHGDDENIAARVRLCADQFPEVELLRKLGK